MTSKLKQRYDSEVSTNLKKRFQEETYSSLRARYETEERVDELFGIGEKVEPERIKASLAEIGKIENMLAQVDPNKLGTLRQALTKSKANVNSEKGLNNLTSFLGAVETLCRHMNEIMTAAKIGDDQAEQPLSMALDANLKPTISKMVTQALNPGWANRLFGNSFLTGDQIKQIGEDFLALTKTEINKMIPAAKQIVQTGEAEKAAKEAQTQQKQPGQPEQQNQQSQQTAQQPAQTSQQGQRNVNPTAPAAFKALQDAGLDMLDRTQATQLMNMILSSQKG